MREALGAGRENRILADEELSRANERLEGSAPQEILRWAASVYGEDLTLSVSFGNPEGMVLLDMLSRITGEVQVFTLDTGFLFEETVRFREEAMKRYPLALEVITPDLSVEEQVERYGPELYSCAPDLCCQVRKIEPQKRFLQDYGAWVTGIRRGQTQQRASTPVLSWEERFGVVKIAPLVNWSAREVEEYVRERNIPLSPLLEGGYKSIGCAPCTRPVSEDEDARAGRWPGMEKSECGLHFVGGAVKRANP
ncbi:MAG: phosphoadenylyl-sulfate reductase [Actinomycetota bacterium]|nr:phosphoadenylyl-sulfate reductase [Actinomycetota bacterium]